MDSALNNLRRLICHKIQPSNQATIEYFGLIKKEKDSTLQKKTKKKTQKTFVF